MVKSTTKALARHTPRLDDVEPISKASFEKTCRGKSSAAKDASNWGGFACNNNRSVSSSSRSVSRAQINLDAPELPVSKLGGLPRVAIGLSEPIASSDLATKVPAIRNNDDCSLALNSSDARKLRAKPERQKKRRSRRYGGKDHATSNDDICNQRNKSFFHANLPGDSTDSSFGKNSARNGKAPRSEGCCSAVNDKGARRRLLMSPSRARSESYLSSQSQQEQLHLRSLRSLQQESDEYWRSIVTKESSRSKPALQNHDGVVHLPSDDEEMASLITTNIRKTLMNMPPIIQDLKLRKFFLEFSRT
ncbi:hypothetical protein MHU86_19251 [Fragilaria crotonensis]|nr:hypothetical protein MHU86_19251 [Fragilaria crotonensis]